MGTIGVEATERLMAEAATRRPEVAFVDAPVTGTRDSARHGQLTILASGPDRARGTLDPVFQALGQRVLWLGPAGLGTRLKLVLNAWSPASVEAATGPDVVPVAAAIAERWRGLVARGLGRLDVSAARLGLTGDADGAATR
jgi:hypothetical protein